MYAPQFDYRRAASVAEASALLKANPGAKLLAGGHSLIPMLKLRLAAPPLVIDIGRIDLLRQISTTANGLRIGALATHAEIARSAEVIERCPMLAEAAGHVGDPTVRNRGTIGGNIAHADPASDLPTVLFALGARILVEGPDGARSIDASSFFTGLMSTALGEHELVTAVEIPARAKGQGMAYAKFTHPASRYAVIGVAAALTINDGVCSAASVAVGGLVPKPVRAASVEVVLAGKPLGPDAIKAAAAEVGRDLGSDLLGDIFASAEYRRSVAPVWVRRALTQAAERAR
jgi:carbon-monoxide dehydrogenase medium subunit